MRAVYFLQSIVNSIINHFLNQEIVLSTIISVLIMVTVMAVYEFFIYHTVLRRSLYNKAFNISIALLPYFVATIILCLQSDIVITLGTIGALAIIRFRTAVKDPVDMIFILWSVHTGVVCGCQLYSISVLTSIVATVVLVGLNYINVGTKSHILVLHLPNGDEDIVTEIVKKFSKRYRIKSRNYTSTGLDYVIELVISDAKSLCECLEKESRVEKFSLMEYDSDDII